MYSAAANKIEILYDEEKRLLFDTALKVCRLFFARPDARQLANQIDPSLYVQWASAVGTVERLATGIKIDFTPAEAREALNFTAVSLASVKINSDLSFRILGLFSLFTPCDISAHPVPPLVEIGDLKSFSGDTINFYGLLAGWKGDPVPIPFAVAMLMWQELLPFNAAHPEISKLLNHLEMETRGIRQALDLITNCGS